MATRRFYIGGGGGHIEIDVGEGASLLQYPQRLDQSVNKASVDNAQSATPIITTRTGSNTVGAFNGGGAGNKGILALFNFDDLPLADVDAFDFTWADLVGAGVHPFVNLIVELTPGSGVYNILVVDDALFAVTPLGDGMYNYAWDRSIGMRIVQDQLVPGYPGSLPPPVTGTVWTPGSPTSWTTRSYLLSDLTAPGFYPNAALHNASSGDGGLPKAPTVLGGFTICMGDSNNTLFTSTLLGSIRFNGGQV